LLFRGADRRKDAISLSRRLPVVATAEIGSQVCARLKQERSSCVYALFFLFPVLVLPVFAPVIRLFGARAVSFAISGAFPVFGAHRRPVNHLYFFRRALHRN
jgi:hypothetical protein